VVQEGEERGGKKGRERVVGKAAGDDGVFILGEGPGWQMRTAPTPNAGRGGAVRRSRVARNSQAHKLCPIYDTGLCNVLAE